jgi:hypothetical protein
LLAKRLESDRERSVSSDIVEGVLWGLLAAGVAVGILYMLVA